MAIAKRVSPVPIIESDVGADVDRITSRAGRKIGESDRRGEMVRRQIKDLHDVLTSPERYGQGTERVCAQEFEDVVSGAGVDRAGNVADHRDRVVPVAAHEGHRNGFACLFTVDVEVVVSGPAIHQHMAGPAARPYASIDCQDVVAGAAIQLVVAARTVGDLIGAIVAVDGVRAGVAVQGVIPAPTVDRVVAAAASDEVRVCVAGQGVGEVRAGQVLEPAQGVRPGSDRVLRTDSGQTDRHASGGVAVGHRVSPGATIQDVVVGVAA